MSDGNRIADASAAAVDSRALHGSHRRGAIVVTGGSGFIGSHLLDALTVAPDARPRVLARDVSRRERSDVDYARVDYRNVASVADALADADVVFHLAGVTKALDDETFHEGNVVPTVAIARALAELRTRDDRPRRLVLVSSQAAMGPSVGERARTEDEVPAPVEAYGRSKLAAEREAQRVCDASGVALVIVRPGAVYGPRDVDFPAIFAQVERNVALYVGSRARRLSLVHVRDLVRALLAAATSPVAAGRSYFVAHPEPATWEQVYRAAAAAAGTAIDFAFDVPQPIIDLAGLVGDAWSRATRRVSLVNSNKVALGRAESWVCDVSRARDELSFTAAIALDDGMRETYDAFRAGRGR